MSKPVCINCKPTKTAEEDAPIVLKIGCTEDYNLMQTCMDRNKGNIASCRTEWDNFRSCYSKRSKEDGH